MSSERLEDCEENLRELLDDLKRRPLSWTNSDFRRKLAEGDALLQNLKTEVSRAPPFYQSQISGRVRGYESDLVRLRKQVDSDGWRQEPPQQPFDDPFESDGERVQLLKNTDALNRASASLHRAQKVSAQTDRMAVNIMDELDDQKSSLIRTRNKLTEIDVGTERSNRLISSLACKAVQNRIILITIIIFEIVILFGVLFYKLYKKFHH